MCDTENIGGVQVVQLYSVESIYGNMLFLETMLQDRRNEGFTGRKYHVINQYNSSTAVVPATVAPEDLQL